MATSRTTSSLIRKPRVPKPKPKPPPKPPGKPGAKPAARGKTRGKAYAAAERIGRGGVLKGNWKDNEIDGLYPELPDGATPLDVMIEAMRRAYRLGGPLAAFPYAEKAAPYLHAKISSIELRTPTPGAEIGMGQRFLVEFVDPPQPEPVEDVDDILDVKPKGE